MCRWVVFCLTTIFLMGCLPENTLEWSEDGSLGLLRADDKLYLIDEQDDNIIQVASTGTQPWPHISADGSRIVYGEQIKCSNLSEGLKRLPLSQVKMIQGLARHLEAEIIQARYVDDVPPLGFIPLPKEPFAHGDGLRTWVIRCLCENADPALVQKLGPHRINEGKEQELEYYNLVVMKRESMDQRQVICTSALPILRPRFAPTGQTIAYLLEEKEKQDSGAEHTMGRLDLFVTSPPQGIGAMVVASHVNLGYVWGHDGQCVVFQQLESPDAPRQDFQVGTLKERTIALANGTLLAEPIATGEQGEPGTHHCTGETRELAQVLFDVGTKIECGLGGRILFSSTKITLPTSNLDETRCSVFCWDPVTRTVTDLLPSHMPNMPQVFPRLFSLSPDGRRVLLPLAKYRFSIYEFGERELKYPWQEKEEAEDYFLNFVPAWKGNQEISGIVSPDDPLLLERTKDRPDQDEGIAIFGIDGTLHRIISEQQ